MEVDTFSGPCQNGSLCFHSPRGQLCYNFISSPKKTWSQAQDVCQSCSGQLATVKNTEEAVNSCNLHSTPIQLTPDFFQGIQNLHTSSISGILAVQREHCQSRFFILDWRLRSGCQGCLSLERWRFDQFYYHVKCS